MKNILKFVIVFSMIVSSFCVEALAKEPIKIILNNQPIESDKVPVNVGGTIYVPLRPVATAMGCEVTWVSQTRTANIKNETTIISMQLGVKYIAKKSIHGDKQATQKEIDTPPLIIDGSIYIPLRVMAEAFGANVGWDSSNNTVMIIYSTGLQYAGSKNFSTFAGNGVKQRYDGTLDKMQFISPSSIDIAKDGTMYVSDGGVIRKISNGKSETIEFEQSYISSSVSRCYGNDVYFLTNAFEDTDGVKYYGIVKLSGKSADGIFLTEAVYSKINDFQIDSNGNIYLIYSDVYNGKTYLSRLDLSAQDITGSMVHLKEIDDGFDCMAIDNNNNIYLGNAVEGSIYYYNANENKLTLCVGVDGQTRFVDGAASQTFFYEPRAMEFNNGYLYVVDYNLVRRIAVNGGVALSSETLAGKVTAETDPKTVVGPAKEALIAPSYMMDIAIEGGKVYITDPKNAVIRVID